MKGVNLLHSTKRVDSVEVGAVARALMKRSVDRTNSYTDAKFYGGEIGALLYERIGKGKKAIPRLLDAMEYALEHAKYPDTVYERADEFVRRNLAHGEVEESIQESKKNSGKGIEGRLSIFTLSIIAGLALSFSSLTSTGYAVSNALGSGQGMGGIFLFLIGLVGMFFSLRK